MGGRSELEPPEAATHRVGVGADGGTGADGGVGVYVGKGVGVGADGGAGAGVRVRAGHAHVCTFVYGTAGQWA